MKRKLLTGLTVLLASAGLAFGQGLTVWTTFADQSLDWLQDEADDFTAAFGIPVNLVRFSVDELKQQVLLAAPQGEAATCSLVHLTTGWPKWPSAECSRT